METTYLVFAGVFGLLVGSFLNVVIYRLPLDMEWVRSRSACRSCRRLIRWYDNIPVVSWLLLGGRCRNCKERIAFRYPLVELITGGLFALGFITVGAIARDTELTGGGLTSGWWAFGFVYVATFLSALVASTFIDFDHTILPDEITKTGMWLAPFATLVFPWIVLRHFDLDRFGWTGVHARLEGLIGSLIGMLVGAGIVWGVAVVGKLIFRKEAMGFGDVKFMGMIGAVLGPFPVVLVFALGCLFGSFFGIAMFLVTRNRYLAFGPYLALGAVIMLLWGEQTVWIVTDWWPRFVRGLT